VSFKIFAVGTFSKKICRHQSGAIIGQLLGGKEIPSMEMEVYAHRWRLFDGLKGGDLSINLVVYGIKDGDLLEK
jgi:hypothetical protein